MKLNWQFVVVVLIAAFIGGSPLAVWGQQSASGYLTKEIIESVGLHLSSKLPTVRQQLDYQSQLTRYQEFTIEWDSLPSMSSIQQKQDVERLPLSPNFTLVERKQGLEGSPGSYFLRLLDSNLVILAATETGEVRAISVLPDPRLGFGESVRPGEPPSRTDYVMPKARIGFRFPDDPQIQQVLFFKPVGQRDGSISIQRIGLIGINTPGLGVRGR